MYFLYDVVILFLAGWGLCLFIFYVCCIFLFVTVLFCSLFGSIDFISIVTPFLLSCELIHLYYNLCVHSMASEHISKLFFALFCCPSQKSLFSSMF